MREEYRVTNKVKRNEEEINMSKIIASITGIVWRILVAEGSEVKVGQDVVIIESMKMEIPIAAEEDGIVKKILIQEGDFVNDSDVLVELE